MGTKVDMAFYVTSISPYELEGIIFVDIIKVMPNMVVSVVERAMFSGCGCVLCFA
mgnify:CR=1 FL=1